MKTDYNQPEDDFGDATARMTRAVFAQGAKRAVLLMRHSAREYRRDIHDLENPLTDAGRALAARFGAALPDVENGVAAYPRALICGVLFHAGESIQLACH